ncbi:3-oxoadipate enol-lactonase [Hyphococcus sp. DH-69]|uniref:3-oxoadipate enol-lactonase n=1 Tax=Hyphococcus formosus TaxID=3143534 RepID=UPI00398B3290
MNKDKLVMSDGASIAWQLDGPADAPTLLLSNSLGTDREMWKYQLTDFTRYFRVLRYDTRGHGLSDAPQGGYGLDRLGRDALELLDALDIQKAFFCGVSLGGMTGQWLGVHAPERIERMALANTAAYMGPATGWQTRIETVLSKGIKAISRDVLDRWFTPEYLKQNLPAIEELAASLNECQPHGYAGCCAAIRDMDMRPTTKLIKCPTLVIIGLRDPATPPVLGEFLVDNIPGAKSDLLDTAHLSNIECPTQFNAAVLDFVR